MLTTYTSDLSIIPGRFTPFVSASDDAPHDAPPTCPRCHASTVEAIGHGHTGKTKWYLCRACRHVWSERESAIGGSLPMQGLPFCSAPSNTLPRTWPARIRIVERIIYGIRILDLGGPSSVNQEATLVDRIQTLIQSGERRFLLNCERLFFIDSTGIGELVRSQRIVQENQGRVVFVNMNERMRYHLATTGLLAFLATAETEADGLLLLGIP